METKKSQKASLENKRFLFIETGMVIALLFVLSAFSFSTKETAVSILEDNNSFIEVEDLIPVTMPQMQQPPSAPPIPVLSDQIDIVDDEIEINDDFKSLDDNNFSVDIKDYIEEVPEENINDEEEIHFIQVEVKPSFNGGDANEFSKWVNSKIIYPEIAKENGVQGKVTLQFTVNKDGSVSNVKVLRGVDSSLDKEAVRVVSNSPKWTPGRQRDRAVKVTYTFPVIFQLR